MGNPFSQRINPAQVGQVLNFASPGIEDAIANEQRLGTAALYNILHREGVAYLADEVGMGKTYQALGVIALTWLSDPTANILVIAPRKAVQQKWHRDYKNFVSQNVQLADNRLKDSILGASVYPSCFCRNLLDFSRSLCTDPDQLFLTRLSSYSWIAKSLGVGDSDETVTGQHIAHRLHDEGLYVDPPERMRQQDFTGATEHSVGAAKQLNSLLPQFDLVVVDEAQKLRTKGSNIRTRVLTNLLNLYPWTEPSEVDDSHPSPPNLLLLSATPAHRSERDIYRQLSYASKEALRMPSAPDAEREAYLDRFMIRRLRKLAGHSKYDYRREKPIVWESDDNSPERIVDELFLAYVQQQLQSELDRDNTGARIEVGFLEAFESYQPSDLGEDADEEEREPGDESTGSTHYDSKDETVAPDHRVLSDIAEKFAEQTDSDMPPHPKQRLVDEAARQSFQSDTPEKFLIFVRRIASVRELTRRICKVYDDVALQRLTERVGSERIRRRVQPHFDFDRFSSPEDFRIYAELVLEADPSDVQYRKNRTEDNNAASSKVLDVLRGSPEQKSAGDRLLRRLRPGGSLAAVFEENRLRFVFRQLDGPFDTQHERNDQYKTFCSKLVNIQLKETFNHILGKHRQKVRDGANSPYFRGDESANLSNVRALFYELCLLRAANLYSDTDVIGELLEIHRDIHGQRNELKKTTSTTDQYDDYIDQFLSHQSFWDLAATSESSSIFVGLLNGANHFRENKDSWLEYREFIKRIIEKNIRVSEAVLDLFIAFDRADGANPERVAEQLAGMILDSSDSRTRHRIEHLITQGSAFEELASGRVSDSAMYAETRWTDFDRQEPALGARGSTSSRYPVIVKFNAPFFPDFLVATDVFREGVDLHLACRRVWHFGMVANPGDLEQRSGRVDRYFSRVHRELQSDEDSGDNDELHIEYPYLAKTIDEQQVARVLQRKLEVQPLMDKGLSVARDIQLQLDRRAEKTARALLRELSELTSDETTPFPVERHLEGGAHSNALEPMHHPTADELTEWLSNNFERVEKKAPLLQPVSDSFDGGAISDTGVLTNLAVKPNDGTSTVVAPNSTEDNYREQPIRIALAFSPKVKRHYLRFSTPLGNHDEHVAAALQQRLHRDYGEAPARLIYDPSISASRSHWRISLTTDLLIANEPHEWPDPMYITARITRLAEIADELEWRLQDINSILQDLTYEDLQS
jgi:superfamily II DNA or RNA helicase